MKQFNWDCRYCGHAQVVTGSNCDIAVAEIDNAGSKHGGIFGNVFTIVCANQNCRELTLAFHLHSRDQLGQAQRITDEQYIQSWNLLPESTAKPQPDYIPKSIVSNYKQACRIKDLSPNASAAMSRRCLQGMIRDYWNVKEGRNLLTEIQAIKDRVQPMTWEAIDVVRKFGNIGAHMKKDVNLIVDVEPNEAQALINLIEILFKDWYVDRHERQKQLATVVELGQKKETQMNVATDKNSENPSHSKI